MNPLILDLKQQYYSAVPFPIPTQEIEEAVEAFMDFLALPDAIKNHISYKICPLHRRGEVGFTHRNPEEGIYNDSKDYFHYHDSILSTYADFLAENKVVKRFMDKASPIWLAAAEKGKELIENLCEIYPFLGERFYATSTPHIILRFIRYNWSTAGHVLAKPHFDAGSCTLAIAESEPGLRIGRSQASLRLVENNPHQALFFLSSNFNRVVGDATFAPAWHDVIQLNEKQVGKPYMRWAVVCFFEALGIEAVSRQETHTSPL